MVLQVKRTGGFAGLTEIIASVDTAQIPNAAAEQVQQIVERIGFFGLPACVSGGTIGADFFRYEIRVRDEDRDHTVTFEGDDSPETAALHSLVLALSQNR